MTSGHDVTRLGYLEMTIDALRRATTHAEKAKASYHTEPSRRDFHHGKLVARLKDASDAAAVGAKAPLDCECSDCLQPHSPNQAVAPGHNGGSEQDGR